MTFLDKLLNYYKINKTEFNLLTRKVNEADIPLYTILDDVSLVKERILDAIKNKEKILIYGDYDSDGILATSILVNTFKKLNYEVDYYIPSRYLDGYGLSKEKVILAKEKGYKLIITVDNGVSALDAIKECKDNDIELIITDHHNYDAAPDVKYFLHPKKSKLSITTSGACIAFYLSYALLDNIDPYLLSLAGTSIISDIMPMKGENRNIVRMSLKYLNKYKFDKFNLLSEEYTYDETTLALKVIPKINAIGRIEQNKEVNILVKYFTTDNYKDLINIKTYINSINEKRKSLTIEVSNNIKDNGEPSICYNLDILNGLTGLIANKLLTTYNKPSCVFSNSNDVIRGSLRSKHGCSMIDFVNENKDLFIEQGGHELAYGIVIKKDNFETFKNKFNEFASLHRFEPNKDNIPITIEEINFANYNLIKSLSPFGQDFKEPIFVLKDVDVNNIKKMGKTLSHLLINVNSDTKIIGFNYPFETIKTPTINLVGKFTTNNFRNNITLNFILEN